MPSKPQSKTVVAREPTRLPRRVPRVVPVLLGWFRANARDLPWRKTRDPYAIWISEIMLQQTQVATVVPYFTRWMRDLPNLQALAAAPDDRILKLWEGLGYYSRVRNIKRAAIEIIEKHGGVFPRDYNQVLDLPGVGAYTAGAICSIAFDQPTAILDGNVARVLARLFAVPGDPKGAETSGKLWAIAGELVVAASHARERRAGVTASSCGTLNESLMELGALVCTPSNPRCDLCPVAVHCTARQRNAVSLFPHRHIRPKSTKHRLAVFVVIHGRSLLVRQRPAGIPNAGFWELPSAEASNSQTPQDLLRLAVPGMNGSHVVVLGTATHSIMDQRISLEAYEVRLPSRKNFPGLEWKSLSSLRLLPFSTIGKKVLKLRGAAHYPGIRASLEHDRQKRGSRKAISERF